MFKPTLFAAAVSLLPLILASPARAQRVSVFPSEFKSYRLTLDDARNLVQANKNLDRLITQHPELADAVGNRLAAHLYADPRLEKAVIDAGLSAKKYIIASWVLFHVPYLAKKSGAQLQEEIETTFVHPDNIAFYKRYKAELEALGY